MTPEIFQQLGSRVLLSKEVEGKIEQAIQLKKFAPGERLPTELELCDSFGVSRTVMREALRMLSARGLISIQKGRGIFVRDYSASDLADPIRLYLTLNYDGNHVLDVVEARKAIEPSVAALAAKNRTETDVRNLSANLHQLEAYTGDYEKLAVLDQDFHILIATASGNPIVPLLMEPIHRLMPQIKSSVYATIDDAKASAVVYHGKILEKIVNRDENGARKVMEEHLLIAELHARSMLQKTAEESVTPPAAPKPRTAAR
jgi:GntR family transcriptional regulator, transcriptional repressor for pyruvate dehydrogenase complex